MITTNVGGGVTLTIERDTYTAIYHNGQKDESRVTYTADYFGSGRHHEDDMAKLGDYAVARMAVADGSPIVYAFDARDGFGYGWNLDRNFDSEYGTAPFPVATVANAMAAIGKGEPLLIGDFVHTCDDTDPNVICGNDEVRSVPWHDGDIEIDAWFLAHAAYVAERTRVPAAVEGS